MTFSQDIQELLTQLGCPDTRAAVCHGGGWSQGEGAELDHRSPIDGRPLARLRLATDAQVERVTADAATAFAAWRQVPAPVRGEYVRRLGLALREKKEPLGRLVSLETGKILQEGLGEVQEMIDICDFAVGLSRQLYGKSMASERPAHRLTEQWHPLGPVGVITAFNFPVAVWSWNAMIGLVCGDPIVWKPSDKAPLCAIACLSIARQVAEAMDDVPPGLTSLLIGGPDVARAVAADPRLPLVSATGSVAMGKALAPIVAGRLGRPLMELGGNNGMIVTPSADLEMALRAIVFAAVGTCGQRCTSLRRVIVHDAIADSLVERLWKVYQELPIGNPLDQGVLVGPMIGEQAAVRMAEALSQAAAEGGKVHGGERLRTGVPEGGAYVRPALVEIGADAPIVQQETFAPILYVMRYTELDEAIAIHNGVPQGLSSAIFTNDLREAERFCSATGSDCGLANVNIGTSGAEIGGAFGGEKDTGGGRESGSDAWKAYMRRATNTINWSKEMPLAQGIRFDV